jgi:restriction endonuclease S subunit
MKLVADTALTTRTLGSIADEAGGIIRTGPFGSQLHESDYTDEGVPVIMPKNIVDGRISTADIARIPTQHVERLAQHKVHAGDIVYGRRGDIGRCALITHREAGWLCGTGCLRISLGDKVIDPEYLCYYLGQKYVVKWLESQAVGATFLNLNTEILRNIEITYPDLAAQRKIVAILSACTNAIDLTGKLIAAKQQYKRGLVQQLLTGKKKFPSSQGWSWRKIGELFHNITRFETWDDEKVYVQAIVKRWSQGIELRPPLFGKQIKTKNLQIIRAGDFLISDIQASYGAMSIVGTQHDGLYVSNVYTILVPRDEHQIHVPYFDQLSRTPLMRHLVVRSSNGFKAERIRLGFVLDAFLQQKIYLPDDVTEQRRIADLLQLCDDEITLLNRKLALLKKEKQGLMQQLLTGKIRVKT